MKPRKYTELAKVVVQQRLTQAATRYGETSTTATVCCNACRTCVQTNLLTLGLAAVAGSAAWITRRFLRDPSQRRYVPRGTNG